MAILANQKILTLDYWKTAHDLRVGDYIFDKEGQLQKVTLVQEYKSEECYQVTFDDHLKVSGDLHLGFQIEDKRYRDRVHQYKGKQKFRRPLKFKKVSDLPATNLKYKNWAHIYSIPTTKPLQFPHQNLPVPPFVFGFWFFNRQSTKRLSPPKESAKLVHSKLKDAGYAIREHAMHPTYGERYISVLPTIESHLGFDSPHRIPNNYLLASTEQRWELLKGILAAKSRQYSKTKDIFKFTSTNIAITIQVQALLESLGHRTRIDVNEYRNSYSVVFRTKVILVENQTPHPKPLVHNGRRYITKISKLPPQLCVHIETEGADNSYLVGEGFIAVC